MKPYPILALAMALMFSCSNDNTALGPVPSGTYAYTGRDSSGAEVARGWLSLTMQDSAHVSGQWQIDAVGDSTAGPAFGNGFLLGTLDKGTLSIDLHPHVVDDGVLLSGTVQNDRIEGQWSWITFAGITRTGPFEAIRQ